MTFSVHGMGFDNLIMLYNKQLCKLKRKLSIYFLLLFYINLTSLIFFSSSLPLTYGF